MKKRKSWFTRLLAVILVILIGVTGLVGWHISDALKPVSATSEEGMFTIDASSTLDSVCDKLAEEGFVLDGDVAYYYAKYKHLTNLVAGTFLLDKSWSLDQIFTTLNDASASSANLSNVTIIEGDWAKDIAARFAEVTNVKADDLLALWNDENWIRSQMSTYPFLTEDIFNSDIRIKLEGFLAPQTYKVPADISAEEITKMLLDQSLVVYNKYAADMKNSSLSVHEIYTLASIVQYESSGNAEVSKNIASVFYNRLNSDMALQSSVTVCYALDFDRQSGNWQACEYNPDFDSPYNTYAHIGLPPGPINNPSGEALDAVLHPNDTDYYYFMADIKTKQVYFAETLAEHEQNIADHPNT